MTYRVNTILLILLPRLILLAIPAPIPSSHILISWNKKSFLTEILSFGISSNSINANLGAPVNSGALSHK